MTSEMIRSGDAIAIASFKPGDETSRIEVLTVGDVVCADEEKPYALTDVTSVIAASFSGLPGGVEELLIDFDHSADKVENEMRQSTRAAGWITSLEVEGDRLMANVRWTAAGRAALENGEYRFISPVFTYDKKTRRVTSVMRAGLTNTPAIRALARVASETPKEGEQGMSLARIAKALGLAEDAAEDVVLASAATVIAKASQLDTVLEAAGHEGEVTDEAIGTVTASLKAEGGEPDPTKFVSMDEYTKLASEVATLTKGTKADKVDAAVAAALKDGKITPAMKDVAMKMASASLETFNEWLATMPGFVTDGEVITGVKAAQLDGKLTAAQKTVCASMGLSEDAYLATLTGKTPDKKEA